MCRVVHASGKLGIKALCPTANPVNTLVMATATPVQPAQQTHLSHTVQHGHQQTNPQEARSQSTGGKRGSQPY